MTNFGQNENVSKTSGGSNNFEDGMVANSENFKMHLEHVAVLGTQNRPVRETIGIVMRAQRRKIEEFGFK